jgi:hypothetical protein
MFFFIFSKKFKFPAKGKIKIFFWEKEKGAEYTPPTKSK